MKSRIIIIAAAIMLNLAANAQPPETIYLGNVAKTGYADDESYGPFNIGFTFTFFGNNYTQFYINSNGMINFGSASIDETEDDIPNAATPNNFIAPFWDDMVVDPSGKILYTTIGASPSRKLAVQFLNMGFYTSPIFMGTFTVILYETSNIIQIQYRQIVDNNSIKAHGSSATIGLENSAGTAGVKFAYHNPAAIVPEQAISFTPSGPTYNINSNAVFDGIYLTTNLSLPGPGITDLISPPENGVIGSSYTFEWSAASYATSYKLYISSNSDLSGSTIYSAGSNLTYDVTGLTVPATYYWGVFASNTTGTSWCTIQKFTTMAIPPLNAVPQTIYVEQGQEKTIKLQYTGGDGSTKTGIITSPPAEGQLYQYDAGVKGSLISSVPIAVSDPGRNVIYVANGLSGNGKGNFNFRMHDDTGDSPEALLTVNVSPPGIPNLIYVSKSTYIELQFDRIMANPAGKEGQFTVTVNGVPATISSLALKTADPYSIVVSLATPLSGTETVSISYTAGDVASAQGGWLLSFTDQSVTLIAQTISWAQSLTRKFNESPLTLTATASSGLGITYESSNTPVATVSGNILTFHSLGTSEITARLVGNATYAPARYIKTLTVSKGDQTITFNSLPDKTYGDADFNLTATASSGLSVSFSSSNTSVATVTGTTVHITGGGTTVITASQPGNAWWNPAPDVPQTLTVNKVDQTITFGALPAKTYGDADFSGGATASSALTVTYSSNNSAVATIVSNMIHITGVGTAVITASQAGNNTYNPAPDIQQNLTVNKTNLTFTADNISIDYGTDLPALTYTISGFVYGDTKSVLDALPTIQTTAVQNSPPGTYPITLSGGSDNNYNYLYVQGTLTVILIPHKDIMYLFTPNNDGINDYWELPDMEEWGKCDVRVFNRWGKLVFADDDYNNLWDGISNGNQLPEGAYYFVIKTANAGTVKGTVNIVR
jgi:gliding motility-associated-like protein